MSDKSNNDSSDTELPSVIVVPAFYNSEGKPLGQGELLDERDLIDMRMTTAEINDWYQEGWRMIGVDSGVAFMELDLGAVASLINEPDTCGSCSMFDGNMCRTTGFSVGPDDIPVRDGCYDRRDESNDKG